MTELRFFRLTLVLLVALLLSVGAVWGWSTHQQAEAQVVVDNSFGDYNRFIAACGNERQGEAWDLAVRARETLARASARRDAYAAQAESALWFAALAAPALVLAFYALRWAMTGRLRPLWLLRRHKA
jgi:hypothetical protein